MGWRAPGEGGTGVNILNASRMERQKLKTLTIFREYSLFTGGGMVSSWGEGGENFFDVSQRRAKIFGRILKRGGNKFLT